MEGIDSCVCCLKIVMVMGRCRGVSGGVTVDRRCDSHQGVKKNIRNLRQLLERYNG